MSTDNNPDGMNELLVKQAELMERVPHTLRPDSMAKMVAAVKIIDVLLRYLNSTGHKPWRPTPLSAMTQTKLLGELQDKVGALSYIHSVTLGGDKDYSHMEQYGRQLISNFGIIEESIEYINTLEETSREDQIEELTDILFFYLEQTLLAGFTWEEIQAEYHRKWDVNIKRYEDAEKGDRSWDKRGEDKL